MCIQRKQPLEYFLLTALLYVASLQPFNITKGLEMFTVDCMEDGTMTLDWDPASYKTKGRAAKALYRALCDWCRKVGMNPDYEVSIWTPAQRKAHGHSANWAVSLEAGPYEWAIFASMQIPSDCAWGYVEPYYSFDLEFVG